MKFKVINKNNNKVYEVYNISYDKKGYPHFLIYRDGQWIRISAKHFRPYSKEDYYNNLNKYEVVSNLG